MEESKELQGLYTIFRATIYISLLLEFSCMHWIHLPLISLGD